MFDRETSTLFERIREKCAQRGWFGPDADRPRSPNDLLPEDEEGKQLLTGFLPPVTEAELYDAEAALTVALPSLLRAIHLSLGSAHEEGGVFGPSYGIMSLEHMVHQQQSMLETPILGGAWHWPAQFLPFCYWGCTIYSYVDTTTGTVVRVDQDAVMDGHPDAFMVEAPSLVAWVDTWIADEAIPEPVEPGLALPPPAREYHRRAIERL